MSAVLDHPEVLTPSDELESIRERVATLTANLQRLGNERDRCIAEAERHHKVVEALPLARSAVTEMHERRTGGEAVSDKQIEQAEANLRNAVAMADRADLAEKGARAAAQRFTDQQTPIGRELTAAHADAKRVLAVLLRERAEESRAQYRRDAESFVATAHARHHGTIAAIAALAQKLGLGDVSAVPCPPAGLSEFVGTGTTRDPNAAFLLDARSAIATEQQKIAEELQLMVEGLL